MKRPKQLDLFIRLNANEASPKTGQDLMSHAWFDLSKRGNRKEIYHEVPIKGSGGWKNWIKITNKKGVANIWDMDVITFLTSQLMDKVNRGEDIDDKILFTADQYFYFTNKNKSGRSALQLEASLERLHTTRVETSIRTEGQRENYGSFYWISEYYKSSDPITKRTLGYAITLPSWLMETISSKRLVLTLDEEFFHIKAGLTKWLYLYCRKCVSPQATSPWIETFELIHKKSSMKSPLKGFTRMLRNIIARVDAIPGYFLEEIENKNGQTALKIIRTRKTLRSKNKKELTE
jgi:plasmid replication initiation protein